MSEEFYLVTVEVDGRLPKSFHGSVTVENGDAENLYYQIMEDVYQQFAKAEGYIPVEQAAGRCGATLAYWHEPLELRRG